MKSAEETAALNGHDNSRDIDYVDAAPLHERAKVYGSDLQLIEFMLLPGESIIAEAGAMAYMSGGIRLETVLGNGEESGQSAISKVLGAVSRVMTNESIFVTRFSNTQQIPQKVALAAPYPGGMAMINMCDHGGKLLCQKGAFLAAATGTRISVAMTKRADTGFFGGSGFVLQKLVGNEFVVVHSGGVVRQLTLNEEELIVDTGCIVAFTSNLEYEVRTVRGFKNILFGREGLFLTTLRGTGTVWVQSMPITRLAETIYTAIPEKVMKNKK